MNTPTPPAIKHKYRLVCAVTSAAGYQCWTVNAASEAEAIALHRAGKSEFEDQELEVTDLGEPEVSIVE